MALVNCPECGNQVSSNATQCIHCGCKFTACPECGNVFIGKAECCPQCGYAFKKVNNVSLATGQTVSEGSSETEIDLLAAWEKASPADRTILKLLKAIKIVAAIIPVIFLIIAVISYLSWNNADDLEKLVKTVGTKNTIQSMVVLACIFTVLDLISDYSVKAFVKIRCSVWMRRMKINTIDILRSHANEVMATTDLIGYGMLAEAAFLAERSGNKNGTIVGVVIRVLFAIATSVSLGCAIMQNVLAAMSANVMSEGFQLQYVALIVLGVIAVAYVACVLVSDSVNEKKYNAWFEKNITGYSENS